MFWDSFNILSAPIILDSKLWLEQQVPFPQTVPHCLWQSGHVDCTVQSGLCQPFEPAGTWTQACDSLTSPEVSSAATAHPVLVTEQHTDLLFFLALWPGNSLQVKLEEASHCCVWRQLQPSVYYTKACRFLVHVVLPAMYTNTHRKHVLSILSSDMLRITSMLSFNCDGKW